MSRWLDPVRRALEADRPRASLFFRNDDVGWADDRLFPLLDRFEARGIPLDLAVIPGALGEDAARVLAGRCAASNGRLRVHQHGWRHANHQTDGRKCEFGAARSPDAQAADLRAGQERLRAMLAPFVDPIFTPPWNRCTQATVDLLASASMRVLSRDAGAKPLDMGAIAALPVTLDWAREMGRDDGIAGLGHAIARAVANGSPAGIMLHHATMDEASSDALDALLGLLGEHENAHCLSMMDCAGPDRR